MIIFYFTLPYTGFCLFVCLFSNPIFSIDMHAQDFFISIDIKEVH